MFELEKGSHEMGNVVDDGICRRGARVGGGAAPVATHRCATRGTPQTSRGRMRRNVMNESIQQSRVWVEIDLAVLRENYLKIRDAVAPCDVIGVLKANAYGLGVEPIALALAEAGMQRFAVAELREALRLVTLGLPVQILGSVLPDEIPAAIENGIVLPVTDLDSARRIAGIAAKQGKTATCQAVVDTGMGRLGMLVSEARDVIRAVSALPNLVMEGIYSHFPMAYRSGSDYTQGQIEQFLSLLEVLQTSGVTFRWRHMANSDAINNFPQTYAAPFNAVRTGINLHGSFDTEGRRAFALRSVLTLKTRLAAVRLLPAGMAIGYGCTYRLPREMRVGTISAGYADGMPMALSNRGHVMIRGRACPVIGRVSMDYTTVSLDQVPDAVCGDEVICLGGSGAESVTVEDWAQMKGTHSYDVICSMGSRVERRFVNGRAVAE